MKYTESNEDDQRKLMDNQKMRKLGWSPKIQLEEGIKAVYKSEVVGRY